MKKKILLFVDWFDPAFKAGGPIRSCVNFAMNTDDSFDIFVFTGDRDLGDDHPLKGIQTNTWINYKKDIKVYYASPDSLGLKSVRSIIDSIHPDFIYLNSVFSRVFTIYPLLLKRYYGVKARIILSPRGMLKPSALNFKPFRKKVFLWAMRTLGISAAIRFHATDDTEVFDVKKIFNRNEVFMASNFSSEAQTIQTLTPKQKGELSILFLGRIHPIKNLDYLINALMPMKGNVRLSVVGVMEQKEYWNYCTELIKRLPASVRVEFLGEIPHHLLAGILSKHHIFALPTKGENFGHAIFDALVAGKPVIISDQTPWRGLRERNAGWDLPLSNPDAFSEALQTTVDWNSEQYEAAAKAAFALSLEKARHDGLKEKYKQIFS